MPIAFASRLAPVALLATLAACESPLWPSGPPSASGAAYSAPIPGRREAEALHLYVATVATSRRLAIERFPLDNGIPSTDPDLVYQGYSGFIAVAGDGTLYSTLGEEPNVVDAFPPGSNVPDRRIDVSPPCGPSSFTVISAIAADASGYLFVLIYSYPGLAPLRAPRRMKPDLRAPCNGVAIYAPNASGKARPFQAIHFFAADSNGLAVDAHDNLYVSQNYPSAVKEYSNAVVDPKRTRTFTGKYLGTTRAVATDSVGNLFVANAAQSYTLGWITRYGPRAKGRGAPSSTIYLQGSGPHLLDSIAVRGRYLYADENVKAVNVYYAHKNGEQSPIDSLPFSKVDSVAVGP
jgi:hypothetical protein